jgi:hypothetical protein
MYVGLRWRLVVLEASWQHGKTMHRQMTAYRKLKDLPPLRSVVLTGSMYDADVYFNILQHRCKEIVLQKNSTHEYT